MRVFIVHANGATELQRRDDSERERGAPSAGQQRAGELVRYR
jgi:hypothetical protein